MKRLTALLLILIMSLMMTACSDKPSEATEAEATADEAAKAEQSAAENNSEQPETEAPVETYDIETKYAVLKYPKAWQDEVDVTIDDGTPYKVGFKCGEQPLFTLVFNGKEGDVLGTLIRDDGNVVVRVSMDKLDKKDKRYSDYSTMQEDVNVIFQHLKEDYQFPDGEIEDFDESVYEIKTDFATLYYPQRWKDKVTVKTDKTEVIFSNGSTPLFALSFGGENGYEVGTYNGKPLKIIDYPVESDEHANMQEDVNVILDNLRKDSKFKE